MSFTKRTPGSSADGPTNPDRTQSLQQVDLAVDRTFLAHERTMMAWLRTSISLVTFGFALFKAFLYLEESGKLSHSRQILGPKMFGIIMVAIGVAALVLAIARHARDLRLLRARSGRPCQSLALWQSMVFAAIGILAFCIVFLEHP